MTVCLPRYLQGWGMGRRVTGHNSCSTFFKIIFFQSSFHNFGTPIRMFSTIQVPKYLWKQHWSRFRRLKHLKSAVWPRKLLFNVSQSVGLRLLRCQRLCSFTCSDLHPFQQHWISQHVSPAEAIWDLEAQMFLWLCLGRVCSAIPKASLPHWTLHKLQ